MNKKRIDLMKAYTLIIAEIHAKDKAKAKQMLDADMPIILKDAKIDMEDITIFENAKTVLESL